MEEFFLLVTKFRGCTDEDVAHDVLLGVDVGMWDISSEIFHDWIIWTEFPY